MNSVFKNDSWKIKSGKISDKLLSLNENEKKYFEEDIVLEYTKPVFFDDNMRILIKMEGEIIFNINSKNFSVKRQNLGEVCIDINNNSITCGDENQSLDIIENQFLEITVVKNSTVSNFNIIKDLKIDSCNPNN